MFHSADLHSIFFEGRSPGSVGNEVAIRFNDGLTSQIDPLKLKSETGAGWLEGHVSFDSGVKASAGYAYLGYQRMLLVRIEICIHSFLLSFSYPFKAGS